MGFGLTSWALCNYMIIFFNKIFEIDKFINLKILYQYIYYRMLNLKKKNYPIEQFIGIVEIIKWFVDAENYSYLNGIQISLFVFKYRFEGFRGSILVYLLGVLFGYIFES